MSNQFKVGDLAIIKICKSAPHLVGKCVELAMRCDPGATICFGGELWSSSHTSWVVLGSDLLKNQGGTFYESGHAMFGEKQLMPLRGDFITEQQKAKEVEEC